MPSLIMKRGMKQRRETIKVRAKDGTNFFQMPQKNHYRKICRSPGNGVENTLMIFQRVMLTHSDQSISFQKNGRSAVPSENDFWKGYTNANIPEELIAL